MKTRLFPLSAFAGLLVGAVPSLACAQDATPEAFARTYADIAYQTYADAADAADTLKEAAATMKREPNAVALAFMRLAWVEARAPYMQAEILRAAGGPAEAAVLAINGPVEPGFIDGAANSIIADAAAYPVIDATLLASLNGKAGEGKAATGFHALELLLWGTEKNEKGESTRVFTDFIAESPNGARRADYLVACADALAAGLGELAAEWHPETVGSYRGTFLKIPAGEVVTRTLEAVAKLAKAELAGKWLGWPLAAKSGAQAESPFSGITHVDVLHATGGIANLLAGAYLGTDKESGIRVRGTGLISVVEGQDAARGTALRDGVNKAILAARALKGPFGAAVAAGDDDPTRKALVDCAAALTGLGEAAQAPE